jgi:hypothetical protein
LLADAAVVRVDDDEDDDGGLEGPKLILTSRLLEFVVACCKYLAAASGVMACGGPPSALTFTVLDADDDLGDAAADDGCDGNEGLGLLDFLEDIFMFVFS